MKYRNAGTRILVVSGDASVREAWAQLLRGADFDVTTAETGRSAQEAIVADPVSVIVLEFGTRFDSQDASLHGSRTLGSLTDVDPLLPVILACDATAELSHETALMADLVLRHPVQPSALLEGIDTLLRESLRERAHRKADYIATLRQGSCNAVRV